MTKFKREKFTRDLPGTLPLSLTEKRIQTAKPKLFNPITHVSPTSRKRLQLKRVMSEYVECSLCESIMR